MRRAKWPPVVEVRFHRCFFASQVQCLHLRRSVFGSRTHVFLSDKAETAVKTRQVFRCLPPCCKSFECVRSCGVEQAVCLHGKGSPTARRQTGIKRLEPAEGHACRSPKELEEPETDHQSEANGASNLENYRHYKFSTKFGWFRRLSRCGIPRQQKRLGRVIHDSQTTVFGRPRRSRERHFHSNMRPV